MEGLAEFERKLAQERAERDKPEPQIKEKFRRHHHRDHHSDRDSRDKSSSRHKHRHRRETEHGSDHNEDGGHERKRVRQSKQEAIPVIEPDTSLVRDDWMTDPTAINIDYIHRQRKESPSRKEETSYRIWDKEINKEALEQLNIGTAGDRASSTRKLTDAEQRNMLSSQRNNDNREPPSPTPPPVASVDRGRVHSVDQTGLNRLRAQLMKAKFRKSLDTARLEAEYNDSVVSASLNKKETGEHPVVIDAAYNRMLTGTRGEVKAVETKRGRERGTVVANDDMTVEDMVREERRTRGASGGEGLVLAERIAKDAKFDNDLEYMDDNAEKLAGRTYKTETSLKSRAIHEYTKMNKVLDTCPLCHHEDRQPPQDLPTAPIVSLATRAFLTLPTEPELTGAEGGAVIVPVEHHTNLLDCDDDEWEEIRNFMKSLTRLYHDQGRDVIFYENAAAPYRKMHAALVAVPIPYDLGATAPAFFRDALLSADEEWSQHKKIIDTGKRAQEGLGKKAFRKSIAKQMPYFHVWFTLDGGLGHVVEDAGRWPKGDLFAREIVGGMLDVDASIIRRQGRWSREDARLDGFRSRWRKFDWTRILTE